MYATTRHHLHDLATVRGGYPGTTSAPGVAQSMQSPTSRVLQASDLLADGVVRWESLRRTQLTRDAGRYLIRDGDVLVPLRAARPTAVTSRDVPDGVVAGGSLALCTVDAARVHPEYLAWYLNHPVAGVALERITQGSNLKFIPLAALRSVEVSLPPLAVQRRIARAAGLHARIAELERQLAGARAALVDAVTLDALRRPRAGLA